MAEGRGKAQADTLRKAKGETSRNDTPHPARLSRLRAGCFAAATLIYVPAGHYIAGDGEVIEGVASVDESAITGEAPR